MASSDILPIPDNILYFPQFNQLSYLAEFSQTWAVVMLYKHLGNILHLAQLAKTRTWPSFGQMWLVVIFCDNIRAHLVCHVIVFCKVVTEYLRQSGSSCGRDRTHPGILGVCPRRTGAGVYVLTGIAERIL